MEQAKMVAKALLRNSDNPQLALPLFKRTLASYRNDFSSLSIIVPILIRARMFPQIDTLHHRLLLLPTPPHHALYSPLHFIYNLLIRPSLKQNCPNFVSWLYKDIIFSKVDPRTYTFNFLIGALCDKGRHLFDRMRAKGCQPNEYTFGILARGYCRDGLASKGLELLDLMKTMVVVSTAVVYNIFVASCVRRVEMNDDEAERMVKRIKEDGLSPNVVTFKFNSRISDLYKAGAAATDDPNHISINCGGAAPATALSGRQWLRDVAPKGSSTTATVKGDLIKTVDPVPYYTARISRSQFSYSFHVTPGQKIICLHFNPVSYHGFQSFSDLFTVEAGPFTLLANFSASITARALAVNTFIKEFCIILQENQPLNLVFSPETSFHYKYNYAFINGIEIISVPSTISYCHAGDSGVRVLGKNYVIHVENTSALEMVHSQDIKWGSLTSNNFRDGVLGVWANKAYNRSWGVFVDVGFRYLVRLHLCDQGLKLSFMLLINNMTALTSADMLNQRGGQTRVWYNNYMVTMEGHKREGKRMISIFVHSPQGFLDRHGPLEGFEVLKLSNPDLSLASPNPIPPREDSLSQTIHSFHSCLGRRNAIATVVFVVICMVNIIVHSLVKMVEADSTEEEENKPSDRVKRHCRCFSLAELQSATKDFDDRLVIGKGGFGIVFRGLIDNGRELVAIKRSKLNSNQGEHQFWTEVETLSKLRHVNLVSLIGCCIDQREMMLVYEYMPYGTFADHLYKLDPKSNKFYHLSWKQRLKICIGAGRALDYLHTGHGIIHRDVKSSNILLDEKFVAKVSDFGLAKTGSGSESESQDATKFKGTIGYIDPDYFKTHKITKRSDTYAFGVVLLEVLCGRPAVQESNEEDKRSLAIWAIDNISKGQVDQIITPRLRGDISPDSLKTFVKVAEKCLHNEPKKRPAMAYIVIKLELALQQQDKRESLALNEIASVDDVISCTDISQKENVNLLVPNVEKSVASTMINSGRKDGIRSMILRISRRLRPRDAFWKTRKSSNNTDFLGNSASAPTARRTSNITCEGNTTTNIVVGMVLTDTTTITPSTGTKGIIDDGFFSPAGELLPHPSVRILTLSELRACTRNFTNDLVLGEGGFGKVYKGWLDEKASGKTGIGTPIAVKRLNHKSMQGFQEWQSEVNFLGKFSHPNLVRLLGYCWEENELLLVYEYMPKGSLENHLFGKGASVQPLPWDIRLKILIGAAKGLAFLHSSEKIVIYRDFKTSNILLDETYHAKLSDFGLARLGPIASKSHVTTQVMGTYGYAAPEYLATGHLYVKSDVYGFGVVMVEMLTGLRAFDANRPSVQRNLTEWIKPYLSYRRKLKLIIDIRLESRYPSKSAFQIAQLALTCLQPEPRKRPSMLEVVDTLEKVVSIEKRGRVHFSTRW